MLSADIFNYAQNGVVETLSRTTPEVIILPTADDVDRFASSQVIEQINGNPRSVLTLPTGNTPIGMYRGLVQAYNRGEVDFQDITVFNLDEYYPIRQSHSSSYASFMRANLMDHVNIRDWDIPNGETSDPEHEARRFSSHLEQHQPVDLAILGIGPGTTCHLGFNERGSRIDSTTRYVTLDSQTLTVNSTHFSNPKEIPHGALTQGISDILRAKKILLLAKGEGKAWGINRTIKGSISQDAPSSFLRLHPHVTLVLDQAAGRYLK